MAFKVVMTPTRPGYPFEIEREILTPIGAEVVVVNWENEAQYVAQAADADAVVQGRGVILTAGLLAQLKKAKAVMNGAVGLDRIDIDAATAHGIAVINVPDVWVNEVADHAMMLLLAVARKLKAKCLL